MDSKPFAKWGVGPEGEKNAMKNCKYAAENWRLETVAPQLENPEASAVAAADMLSLLALSEQEQERLLHELNDGAKVGVGWSCG